MKAARLLALCWVTWALAGAPPPALPRARILWTGDILLSRQVETALAGGQGSPWQAWRTLFAEADWVAGNLEGAVGRAEDCREAASPCFPITAARLPLLVQAGFQGLSVENNHAWDLGETGRQATLANLRDQGLLALDYETSPHFLDIHGIQVAVVALNLVGGPAHHAQALSDVAVRQKLRLARALSGLVIVSVHWGTEFLEWPSTAQREAAAWLVGEGADLVIGHHPHVVQPPEAVAGHPVFFSLGNHLFDQKYPATRQGLVADCRIVGGSLSCQGIASVSEPGSGITRPDGVRTYDLPKVALHVPLACGGYELRAIPDPSRRDGAFRLAGYRDGRKCWESPLRRFASVETARLDGREDFLVSLEWHASVLDHETALRPYVYQVTPRGLVARWRGTALAWPLLDARVLPGDEGILAALHRGDSFLTPGAGAGRRRVAAYRWNGFGFSGVEDPELQRRCRQRLGVGLDGNPERP